MSTAENADHDTGGAPRARIVQGAVAGETGGLRFPDAPQMQLETLLGQLRDQADDVLQAQGRLRGLLRANSLVASDLSLPVVLRRIVDAARELVGARYAALGVIGWDGRLEEFVHSGMDDATVERIGALPRGAGILGLLIDQPTPLRLATLSEHPLAAGFPPNHPPMRGFLGVPIRVGSEVFGNLYLTEKVEAAGFSEEDEQLAVSLGSAAGAAIANARMFAESEQRRRWLVASGGLAPRLLAADGEPPLDVIVREAAAAAEADFGLIVLPAADDQVTVAAGSGDYSVGLVNRSVPLETSLAGPVLRRGKATLVSDHTTHVMAFDVSVEIGPLILVPLIAGDHIRGVLELGRLAGRRGLTESDLRMAEAFANQAAVALELLDARADQLALAQLEDHDRIARDLHDHVIQELFAAGMSLQALAGAVEKKAHADRILGYADTLDRVIAKIRTSIFQLRHDSPEPIGLQNQVLGVSSEHAAQLGFSPEVRFAGSLNTVIDAALGEQVLAVLREALSNCARHASATAVDVSLQLQNSLLIMEVTDNGVGLGRPTRFSGLANMQERAERNGGTFEVSVPETGGTRITWTARTNL